MYEIIPNITMFGKRNPRKPYRAVLRGETFSGGQPLYQYWAGQKVAEVSE